MNDEKHYIQEILNHPCELEYRLAFADWLEQQKDARAELYRIQCSLLRSDLPDQNQLEARLQDLLQAGVAPVTATTKNSIGMELALLPAGDFLMGARDEDKNAWEDERPLHRVTISRPFFCGVSLVSEEQYECVIGKKSDRVDDSDFPIHGITWFDAVKFCNMLSEKEGLEPYYQINGEEVNILSGSGYRLPTEAEWEYACRAGTSSIYFFGSPKKAKEFATYESSSLLLDILGLPWLLIKIMLAPFIMLVPFMRKRFVKERKSGRNTKLPNPWGLYDMLGNEWEWCQDWHGADTYFQDAAEENVVDPAGSLEEGERVVRGGYISSIADLRSSNRMPCEPDSVFGGFRVVRNAENGVSKSACSIVKKKATTRKKISRPGSSRFVVKEFFYAWLLGCFFFAVAIIITEYNIFFHSATDLAKTPVYLRLVMYFIYGSALTLLVTAEYTFVFVGNYFQEKWIRRKEESEGKSEEES